MSCQLLEDHLQKLREEEGVLSGGDEGEDGDAGWEGWDLESDSSEESSVDWIDVSSDGEDDLQISDSEDEDSNPRRIQADNVEPSANKNPDIVDGDPGRISSLATTKARSDIFCFTLLSLTAMIDRS